MLLCSSPWYGKMASPIEQIVTRRNTWKVNTTVHNIIGKGAYGIVYKSTDERYKEIAAKSVTGTTHRILSQDVNRLLELNHENIVKIYDIHQTDKMMWMIMELCPQGDLNKFFQTKDVKLDTKLDLMKHITKGIQFLHSQNIIHRDIKPANILVAGSSRLQVKLTDFDVTKILDPDIETSVMSSNVGTNAFKSPEFFLRNKQGKIQYHRNVDTFAAGLTFLAIIQYEDGSGKMLLPHIETPRHESELHQPIGSLLVERIKNNVQQLNIVVTDKDKSTAELDVISRMKKLIEKMTSVEPEKRSSSTEVLQILQGIRQYHSGQAIKLPLGKERKVSKKVC